MKHQNAGRTDVAPDRSDVQHGALPYDRVDERQETRQRGPDDIGAGTRVPRLPMPWQRDEDQKETQERDDGEQRVGRADVHGGRTPNDKQEVVEEMGEGTLRRMPFNISLNNESLCLLLAYTAGRVQTNTHQPTL